MGFDIGKKDLLTIVPWVTTVGLGAYVVYTVIRPKVGLVNPDIQKDQQKVANTLDVEDIGDKISLCRCWRSKKFPVCDGTHNTYNKAYGDNVGPVTITKKVP